MSDCSTNAWKIPNKGVSMNCVTDNWIDYAFNKLEEREQEKLKYALCIECGYTVCPEIDDAEYRWCKHIDDYVYLDQHPIDNDCEMYF